MLKTTGLSIYDVPALYFLFMNELNNIRTFSFINIEVLKKYEGMARALTFWYVLRSLDKPWITEKEFIKLVTEHSLLSKKTIRNHLKRGNGLFWNIFNVSKDKGSKQIHIIGQRKVCDRLGFVGPGQVKLFTITELLDKSIAYIRSILYVTHIKGDSQTKSRAFIEEATNKSRPTQIKYERKHNIKVQHNYTDTPRLMESGYVTNQIPNTFYSALRTPMRKSGKKHGYVVGSKVVKSNIAIYVRHYYKNETLARKAVEKRNGQGYVLFCKEDNKWGMLEYGDESAFLL